MQNMREVGCRSMSHSGVILTFVSVLGITSHFFAI